MRIISLDQLQQFTAVNLLSDPGAIGGPVVIPQCAQIRIRWTLEDGKTGFNVLYGRYAGGFAGTVAQANAIMAALVSGANWTSYVAFLASTTALAGVDIRDVNTPFQAVISSTNAAVPGTSVSPALPNEVCICLTERTALTGRANRGRAYVPGQATNALGAGNVIAAGAVAAVQNFASNFIPAFTAGGYTLVIGQKQRAAYTGSTGSQHPARAATSVAVTSVLVRDNHWDTQRRRGLK